MGSDEEDLLTSTCQRRPCRLVYRPASIGLVAPARLATADGHEVC